MDEIIRLLLLDSGQIEPDELFYPLEGYEDLYLLSPYGKVYSKHNKRIMKSRVNKPNPYLYITLGTDQRGDRKTKSIHRLVAEHFVPNFEQKEQVHHLDDDPTNNYFKNLKWVTAKENLDYQRKAIKERGSQKNPKRK